MNFRHLQKFSVYLNREKLNQLSKLATANQPTKHVGTYQKRFESSNSTLPTVSHLLIRTPTRKLKSNASIRRKRPTFTLRQNYKTFQNSKTSDKKSLKSCGKRNEYKKFERKSKIFNSSIRKKISTLLKTLNVTSQIQEPTINLLSSNEINKTRKFSKILSSYRLTNITNKVLNNLHNNPNLFLQQRRNYSSKSKETFDKTAKVEKKKRLSNKTCPEPPCDEEKTGLPYFYKRVPVQGEDGESKTYEMQRVYFKYPTEIIATEDASKQTEITSKTDEKYPKDNKIIEVKTSDEISNAEYIKLLEKTPLKKLEHAYYMKISNDSQSKRNISTTSSKTKSPLNTPKESWISPDSKFKKRFQMLSSSNQAFYLRTLKSDSKFAENLTSLLTESVTDELNKDIKEIEEHFEEQNTSLRNIKMLFNAEKTTPNTTKSNLRIISKVQPEIIPQTRLSQLEDKSNIQFENPTNEDLGRNFRNDILDIIESIKTPRTSKRTPPTRNKNKPSEYEAPKTPRQLSQSSSTTHQLDSAPKKTSIMDLFKADVQNIIHHLNDTKSSSLVSKTSKKNTSKLVQKTIKDYLDQIYDKREETQAVNFKTNSSETINRNFERQPQFISFRVPEMVPPTKGDNKVTTKKCDFTQIEELEVSVPFEKLSIRQTLPKPEGFLMKRSSKQSISKMELIMSSRRQSNSKLAFEQASKKCLSKTAVNSAANDDNKTKNLPFYQIPKIPGPLKSNKLQCGQLDIEDIKDAILKAKLSKQDEIKAPKQVILKITDTMDPESSKSNKKYKKERAEAVPTKSEETIHDRIINSLKFISNTIHEQFLVDGNPPEQPKKLLNTSKNSTEEILMLTTNIINQLEAISSVREEPDDESTFYELPYELLEVLQKNTVLLKELLQIEEAKQSGNNPNTVQMKIELSDNLMETFAERFTNFVLDIKHLSETNLLFDTKTSKTPPKAKPSSLQLLKQNFSTINQSDDSSNKNKPSKTKILTSNVTVKPSEDELKIRKLADKLFQEYLLRKRRQIEARNIVKTALTNLKPVDSKVSVPQKKLLAPKPETPKKQIRNIGSQKSLKEPLQEVGNKLRSSFKPSQEPPKEDYISNIIKSIEKELSGPSKADKTPMTPSQQLKEQKSKEVTQKVIQAVENVFPKVNTPLKLTEKEIPSARVRDPPATSHKRGSYSIIEPIDGLTRPVTPPKPKIKPTIDLQATPSKSGGLQPNKSFKDIKERPNSTVQLHTDRKSDKSPIVQAIDGIFPVVPSIESIIPKQTKIPANLTPKPSFEFPIIRPKVNIYNTIRPIYLDPSVKKLKNLPVNPPTVSSKRNDASKFLTKEEKIKLSETFNPKRQMKLSEETIDDTLKSYLKKNIKPNKTPEDKTITKDESLNTWEPTSAEFSQTIKKPDEKTPTKAPIVKENNVEVLRKKENEKYNHTYNENNPNDAERLEIYRKSSSSKQFEDSFSKTFKRTMSDFSVNPKCSRKIHLSYQRQNSQIPNKKTPKIPIGIRNDYSNKYEIKYLSDKNESLNKTTKSTINLLHPPVTTSKNNNTPYSLPFKQQEKSVKATNLLKNINEIANRPLKTSSETIINSSIPEKPQNNTKISENTATYLYISLRIPPEMDKKISETIEKFSECIDAELEIDSDENKQMGLKLSLVSSADETTTPEILNYRDKPFSVDHKHDLLNNDSIRLTPSKYKENLEQKLIPKDYRNIFAEILKPNNLSQLDNARINSEIEDLFNCLANCEKINNTDISIEKANKFNYPLKDLDTLVDCLSNETRNFPFQLMNYNKPINPENVIQVYNLHEIQNFQDIHKNKKTFEVTLECSSNSKDPFGRKKPDPYEGKYQEACPSSDFLQKLDLRCDMKSSGAEVPKQPPPPASPCCNPFEMPGEVQCDDVPAEEKLERLKQLHCSMINYEPKIEPPSTKKKCPVAAKPRKKKKICSPCQKKVVCKKPGKSVCGGKKKKSKGKKKKKSKSLCGGSKPKKEASVCKPKSPCGDSKPEKKESACKPKSPCGDSKPKKQASACKPRKKSKSPCGSKKSKSPCGDSKPKKQASACKPRKKSKSPCGSKKSKSPCEDSKPKKQASACKPRKKSKSPCGSKKSKSPCGDSKPKKQASACKPRKKSKSPCGSKKSKSPCEDSKPKKASSACKPKKKSKSPCGSTKKKSSSCRKSRSKSKPSCGNSKSKCASKTSSPCGDPDSASKCRNKLPPKSSKCMSSLASDSESVKSFCSKKSSVKVKSFCENSKSKTSVSTSSKDKPSKTKSRISISNLLPPPNCKSSSTAKSPKGKGPSCGSPKKSEMKTTTSGSKSNLSTFCNNKSNITIKYDYNHILKPVSNETYTKKNITTEPPKDVEDYCNAQSMECDCKPKRTPCPDNEKDVFNKICRKQKRGKGNKSVCPYRKSTTNSSCPVAYKINKQRPVKCIAKKPNRRVTPDPFDSVPSKTSLAQSSSGRSCKNVNCPTKNRSKKVLGSKVQKSNPCLSQSKNCNKRNRLTKKKKSATSITSDISATPCGGRVPNYFPDRPKKRLTPAEKLQEKVPNCNLSDACTKLKRPKKRGKKCKQCENKRYSSTHVVCKPFSEDVEDVPTKYMTDLFNTTSKQYISKISSQSNQNLIPLKDKISTKSFISYKFYQDDDINCLETLYNRKLNNKQPWKTAKRPEFYYNPKKTELTNFKKTNFISSPFTCVKPNFDEPPTTNFKAHPKKFNPCDREFILPTTQWYETIKKSSKTSVTSNSRNTRNNTYVGSFSEQPLTKYRTSQESFTRSNCSDCKKKEDLCKNNQDPCIKKKNPCQPKKVDTCPKKRCTFPIKKKLITKPPASKKGCKLLKEQSPCERENPCKRIKELNLCSGKGKDGSCTQDKKIIKPCTVPGKNKQKTTCKITEPSKKPSKPKTTCKPKQEKKPDCCPKKKKPNPCKESCTPKKQKPDPCKSAPPKKKDVDPCSPKKKEKSDPCKKKDPCKPKKKCAPGNAPSVVCPTSEENYKKLIISCNESKTGADPWNREVTLIPNPKSGRTFRTPRLISSKYQKHPLSFPQIAWNDLYMRLFSSCKNKKKPSACQSNPCGEKNPCETEEKDDCDDEPCAERDIAESKQIQPHPKDPPTTESMKCLKFMKVPEDEAEKPNAKRRYRIEKNPCGKGSKPLCPKNTDPCSVDVSDIDTTPAEEDKPKHPCRMLQSGPKNESEEKYKEILRLGKLCKNGPNPWCKKVVLIPCGRTGNAAQCTPGIRPDPNAKKEYKPNNMCLPPKYSKKETKKKSNPCDDKPKEPPKKCPPPKKTSCKPEQKENKVSKKMEELCGKDKTKENPCAKRDPCKKKAEKKNPCKKDKPETKSFCKKSDKGKKELPKPSSCKKFSTYAKSGSGGKYYSQSTRELGHEACPRVISHYQTPRLPPWETTSTVYCKPKTNLIQTYLNQNKSISTSYIYKVNYNNLTVNNENTKFLNKPKSPRVLRRLESLPIQKQFQDLFPTKNKADTFNLPVKQVLSSEKTKQMLVLIENKKKRANEAMSALPKYQQHKSEFTEMLNMLENRKKLGYYGVTPEGPAQKTMHTQETTTINRPGPQIPGPSLNKRPKHDNPLFEVRKIYLPPPTGGNRN